MALYAQSLAMMDNPQPARAQNLSSAEKGETRRPFPLRLIVAGFLQVMFFVGVLAAWSYLAPIEGAVVSPGIVSVLSHRKQIQHLEGGIVEFIHVKDGDSVAAGKILVKLRDIKPEAQLNQLEAQYYETLAIIARIIAERDKLSKIDFPEELIALQNSPSVKTVMNGQSHILTSKRSLIRDKLALVDKQIKQTEEEIRGLRDRIKEKAQQKKLILQELETIEEATRLNLIPKLESLKLQQRVTEINDDLITYRTSTGQLEHDILKFRLQKSESESERIADITEQLREKQAQRFDLFQRIIAARDVLQRTQILSPIDGIVVNLQIHSTDGVIQAGQALMEIVPAGDELIVETRIDPEDIDEVWIGMPADVRLTSHSRRRQVPIEAKVSSISADRISNPETGQDYYSARIMLSADALVRNQIDLVAGMGAEVYMKTAPRSPLDYLLEPIMRTLNLGLREG